MKNRIFGFLRANLVNLIVFIFCFLGAVVLFSSYWITKHFEVRDFETILFHLRFPLLGNGVPLVGSYFLNVIFASFIVSFCIAWMRQSVRLLALIYNYAIKAFDKISHFKVNIFRVVFAIALFVLCTNIVINRFKIKDYLHTQTQYSQLYEEHYKSFDLANFKDFSHSQNLIVILVESLESNLANHIAQNGVGGGGNRRI